MAKLKPPLTASTRPVWGSIATRPPETSGTWQRVKAAGSLGLTISPLLDDPAGSDVTITTSPGLTTSAVFRGAGPKLPFGRHGRAHRISENGMRPVAPSAKPIAAPSG